MIFSLVLKGFTGYPVTIILTSDQQLNDLLDPDKKIDLSTGFNKRYASLREVCELGQKRGDKILTIAFDEFFRQYREQAGTKRLITPDSGFNLQHFYLDELHLQPVEAEP